ncbi:MAG: RNA methyltransferase [Ahrensia sp.]|nr:RNA methyltransferase [Ahrensia sp.]
MTMREAGRVEEITSTANPRIKAIRALSMKKHREREGLFIAEGLKLAADALEGGWTIRQLIRSKPADTDMELARRIDDIAARSRAQGGDIILANAKVLSAITRRDNAQTVVSVIEQKMAKLSDVKPHKDALWVALDRVRDPGNLGTIIRAADAFGASGIILVGDCTDPFSMEAVRATMGSLFHVPIVTADVDAFQQFSDDWRGKGGNITGTHLEAATDHRSLDYASAPEILLMGNEQQGLPAELVQSCSRLALIAMNGQADSLNLAVATGIMVFAARSHALGPTK